MWGRLRDAQRRRTGRRPHARRCPLSKSCSVRVFVWIWRSVSRPIVTAAMRSFIHVANLVFQEAGHILFLPAARS